jgi:hypothetical protein
MAHGGKRPGAGRRRGSINRKTTEIVQAAVSSNITPLEVMLQAMYAHHEAGRLDEAAAIAKDAAPYVHPRLSTVQHKGVAAGSRRVEIIEVVRPALVHVNGDAPTTHPQS